MNNNQSLAVIDMQDYFRNSRHCLAGVLHEIEHAMREKMPIFIVEYWDRCYQHDGPDYESRLSDTNQPILDLLKGYRHKVFVKKYNDGGGYEIQEAAIEKNFNISNMRMVGVNRSFCVYRTADQLIDIGMDNGEKAHIEVVRGASWCSYPKSGLENLKDLGVKLVNARRK